MADGLLTRVNDLSYQRTWKQAIVFYIVWFLMAALGGAVASLIGNTINPLTDPAAVFAAGVRYGAAWAVVFCTCAAVATLWFKRLSGILDILAMLAAVLLSLLLGAIAGLLPVAYLSTRPKMEKEKAI